MSIIEILKQPLHSRIKTLKEAKDAYYNSDSPILTDEEYDKLEDSIKAESNEKIEVGSNSRHNKTSHTSPMLSLDKFKINRESTNEKEILAKSFQRLVCKHPLTLSWKYDGTAMNVEFKGGKLIQIVSRGDGIQGIDRTAKLRHIIDNDPTWQAHFTKHQSGQVRCECIVDFPTFEKFYSDQSHPRNTASGLVSDENLETGRGHLRLIALEGIDSQGNIIYNVSEIYDTKVNINGIKDLEHLQSAFAYFKNLRKTLDFPTDGLVLSQEINTSFEHDGHYPNHAIAIKFTPPQFETIVTNIEWNLHRTGRYVPNVRFQGVEIDGRIITKASGHNLEWLVTRGIEIGAKIGIELAGDIIPYISGKIN